MLIRFFRMLIFSLKTDRMNKSALLGEPHLHIPPGGIINGGSLEGKMVRSYPDI